MTRCRAGYLEEYLAALKLPIERMRKLRNNPRSKIPDVMARRCEKYLGQRRGWIDQSSMTGEIRPQFSEDVQALLVLYASLTPKNKSKLYAMGQLLLD